MKIRERQSLKREPHLDSHDLLFGCIRMTTVCLSMALLHRNRCEEFVWIFMGQVEAGLTKNLLYGLMLSDVLGTGRLS